MTGMGFADQLNAFFIQNGQTNIVKYDNPKQHLYDNVVNEMFLY